MKKFNIETDNKITVVVRKNRIFVNSRIGALNVIKVWVIRQSITDIGT